MASSLLLLSLNSHSPVDQNMFLSVGMDLSSTWTHNQCGLYKPDQSMHSVHICYLLALRLMWQFPRALPSQRLASLGKVCLAKPLKFIPSKASHELNPDIWPKLKLFVLTGLLIKEFKSSIFRLMTTSPPTLISFGILSFCHSLPKQGTCA